MFGVQWLNRGCPHILGELHCSPAAVADQILPGAPGKLWCQFLLQTCQVMTQHDTYHLSSRLGPRYARVNRARPRGCRKVKAKVGENRHLATLIHTFEIMLEMHAQ